MIIWNMAKGAVGFVFMKMPNKKMRMIGLKLSTPLMLDLFLMKARKNDKALREELKKVKENGDLK